MVLSYNTKQSIKKYLFLLIEFIFISWIVITIVFFLMNAIRGGEAAIDPSLPKDMQEIIKNKMGLNNSIFKRYFTYLFNLITKGDLGISTFLFPDQHVQDFLIRKLIISFQVGILGVVFSLIIGIPLGIYVGRRPGSLIDSLATILIAAGFAIPSFVFAIFLMLMAFGIGVPFTYDLDNPASAILPAFALAIPSVAGYVRYLRTSISQEYNSKYVQFAKIKGCKRSRIIWLHVLKPAMFPIATFLPLAILGSFLGSIIIETTFAIPGAGSILISAIQAKDYDVVLAIILIFSFITILGYFIRDILYTILDPRTRV